MSFDSKGKSVITLLSTGAGYALENIRVSHKYLDPSMVTEEDIIGAYDVETGKETGLELVRGFIPCFISPQG